MESFRPSQIKKSQTRYKKDGGKVIANSEENLNVMLEGLQNPPKQKRTKDDRHQWAGS